MFITPSYNRPVTSSEYKTLLAVDTDSRYKQVVSRSYLIGRCFCWIRHCLVLWWLEARAKCLAARVPRCRSAHLQHGFPTCGHPSGGQHPFSLGRSGVESYERLYAGTWVKNFSIAPTIDLGYGLEGQQFESWKEREIFLLSPDKLWSPLSFIFNGYRDSFPRAERPECEVVSI
jgi:hypothetical protein